MKHITVMRSTRGRNVYAFHRSRKPQVFPGHNVSTVHNVSLCLNSVFGFRLNAYFPLNNKFHNKFAMAYRTRTYIGTVKNPSVLDFLRVYLSDGHS